MTIIATDVSEYRIGLTKQVGADHALNVKVESPEAFAGAIYAITGGEGVDAALEMSGDPGALHQAFRSVKNGGRVSLFGIPTGSVSFDLPNEIIFKGIRVYGITGRRLFETWYRLAGLFKAGLESDRSSRIHSPWRSLPSVRSGEGGTVREGGLNSLTISTRGRT
ncbi:MAG TPA: zinc-binding dehydrogenase [Nitrospiraceae bacterium]|nr:zinc-binding dehydrogenase [Nitrospiraceae bacterium]